MDRFMINKCDLSDIILEIIRFVSHISLLHVCYSLIDDKEEFLGKTFIKTIIFTVMAVILYHFTLKKAFSPIIEKMKNVCFEYDKDIKHDKDKKDNQNE